MPGQVRARFSHPRPRCVPQTERPVHSIAPDTAPHSLLRPDPPSVRCPATFRATEPAVLPSSACFCVPWILPADTRPHRESRYPPDHPPPPEHRSDHTPPAPGKNHPWFRRQPPHPDRAPSPVSPASGSHPPTEAPYCHRCASAPSRPETASPQAESGPFHIRPGCTW